MFAPVYLDHNASTPTDPAVLEAMLPYFSLRFGNASSRHEYGRAARRAIDEARSQVAAAVGAHATEVVFTSGGSEANNLLLKGAAACLRPGLVAVSAIEHPCVIKPAEQLARRGWMLEKLAVDCAGRVDPAHFAQVMERKPKIVSLMLANNETGVLQDVASLAELARRSGAWFHSDAVQAVGKIPVDFRRLNAAGVHALTLSAHKIGGPKGAGALLLDKRVELEPLIAGGGHERGLRSGTENVAAIVGFGVACELAATRQGELARRLRVLRGQLEAGLQTLGATIFGQTAERLPNTVYFAFRELDGETLVGYLDRAGFAVASGAACSSANPEPSHVLRAMGVDPGLARGAVRVSLGVGNDEKQVAGFLSTLQATIAGLQRLTAMAF
ncbi:MAG TPA: cysteine desulfurase family protein [Accumulibacter sp.]|uniref:cysteine desulfurase family protein n=1 Tax=Accumulibacter sp. TaxID=2053492 RepID=UPI0025D1659F|nr:cysteine desulfurase family protein [Accumulibacter sp.]MCM8597534.1 cysteine desulfurase [Accumulibacter sp.]MCM8661660.1 cysteine desulfurase [Accumulibacter sp.]HNC52316.1 cysteine desulfurase family protein [Accumulibacter sp.]